MSFFIVTMLVLQVLLYDKTLCLLSWSTCPACIANSETVALIVGGGVDLQFLFDDKTVLFDFWCACPAGNAVSQDCVLIAGLLFQHALPAVVL